MPTNKNAVLRYKVLDELLSDRNHYYSRQDLMEKVNAALDRMGLRPISKRSIELDLHDLEMGPFYASYEEGRINDKRYIRYDDPSFSIFSKKLSRDELALLSSALDTLGQFKGLPNFEWLDSLKEKITSEGDLNDELGRKIIEFSSNPYLRNSNFMATIFSAISNRQVIRIRYSKFRDKNVKVFTLSPYRLKQYNDRWYLVCRNHMFESLSVYPLDRIMSIDIVFDEAYIDIDPDEIDEHFEDIVGISYYPNEPVKTITLALSQESFPYVDTKPIHGSQAIPSDEHQIELHSKYPIVPPDWTFMTLECRTNKELVTTLYSLGPDLIVLAPEELKKSIMERLTASIHNYIDNESIRERRVRED